jgi:hypothetical protein
MVVPWNGRCSSLIFIKMLARFAYLWNHTVSDRCDESWKGWSAMSNKISECSLNT